METRGVLLAVVVLLAILGGIGVQLGSTGQQLLVEAERARRQSALERCAERIAERIEGLEALVSRVSRARALAGQEAIEEASYRQLDALLSELARDPALIQLEVLPLGFGPSLAGFDRSGRPPRSGPLDPATSETLVAQASSGAPGELRIGVRGEPGAARLAGAWRTGRGWVVYCELELDRALAPLASAAGGGEWTLSHRGGAAWPPGARDPFEPHSSATRSQTRVHEGFVEATLPLRGGSDPWRLLARVPLQSGFSLQTQAALALALLTAVLVVGLGIYGARAASLGESLRSVERQERQLQGMFDAITDPVLVLDPALRVVRTNRAAERVRPGQAYEEVLAERGVDEPRAERAAAQAVLEQGEPRVRELQAGERTLEVAQFPIFAADLSVAGVVEHTRDVTATKALQAQLVQSEKLSTLGEMAAGIAHEINNPVGVISMFAQLLSEELKERGDLEDALEKVETIEDQASNVGEIVKGLLRFARKSEGVKVRFDARDAVERALAILKHQKISAGLGLEVDLGPDPLPVLGDEGQLAQVVLNLAVNACHAMGAVEGAKLTLAAASGDAEAGDPAGRAFGQAPEARERVRIQVADRGTGIPPEKLDRIFEPFFTTKGAGEGTGLGLSVGFAIIRDHGGCIWVDTRAGEGTTFTLDLPRDLAHTSGGGDAEAGEST